MLPTNQSKATPLEVSLESSDQQVANARIIIEYGSSGLGKSTEAEKFARYEYEKTGLPGILVSAEDSSKNVFEPLISIGVVKPIWLSKVKQPLVWIRKITQGRFPLDVEGKTWSDPIEPGQYGFVIVEGLSTLAEQVLEDQRENHRFLREQKGDAFELGGEKFAPASQTAYGFTQQEMIRALKSSGMLPVDRVLWTAHEAAGTEDNEAIRGPGLVGKAGTNLVQKWCGVLLHVEEVRSVVKASDGGSLTVQKPRVYFTRHPDPKLPAITYPAKVTLPPAIRSRLNAQYPNGYYEPTLEYGSGLDKFLETEERLIREAAETGKKWKEQIDAKKGGKR